jgi:hypothetical protein
VTLPLSEIARALLGEKVTSLLQLDVLLLVYSGLERWWDAEQVAQMLRVPASAASAALEDLATGNLLDVKIGNTISYRFAPSGPETAAVIREVSGSPYEAREVVVGRHRLAARARTDGFGVRRRQR